MMSSSSASEQVRSRLVISETITTRRSVKYKPPSSGRFSGCGASAEGSGAAVHRVSMLSPLMVRSWRACWPHERCAVRADGAGASSPLALAPGSMVASRKLIKHTDATGISGGG